MENIRRFSTAAAGAAVACLLASNVQASGGVDEQMLLELKKMIEQQQQQLDRQASEIANLKEQLGGTSKALDKKVDKEELEKLDTGSMITSRFEHVDVNLYGQINKGVLWSDDGNSSKAYFVDNSNSQSRLGLNASVSPREGFSVGGKIEYGIKSNATSDVSQLDANGATSVNWNLRHADLFFNSTTMGKLSLGYGSSASDGTAEVDFSGTDVVTYSEISDFAGGQYFYDNSQDTLSEVRVKNVYSNMDGLGRDDRLRYDTPSFAGFSVAASAVSGDAYDTALRYSRSFGDTKVAAAIAWASPGDVREAVDNQYDGSVSVLFGNGLNATLAAGSRDLTEDGRDDPTFWYGKLGYRLDIWSLGKTSFSIDYAQNDDLSRDGDEAKSWSVAAVQDIPAWGTEIYLAFRNHELDGTVESYDSVNSVLGGARVKF